MILEKKAFSLIEIMVWILIVSIVMVSWFEAYTRISFWKINLMENTNIQKDSFYFSEKIFQLIKEWGTIDYEEYFNRSVIWTTFSSWHYDIGSWFWNFWRNWVLNTTTYWDWFYYCVSKDWTPMWNWWCFSDFNTDRISIAGASHNLNYIWYQQRYWQYSYQFIDYNSNSDLDLWDEDSNWSISWDDDDEFLWLWPISFPSWTDVKEIYLISWDKKSRTLIRWNVIRDPDSPSSETCSIDLNNIISWDWCRWTIEFLKLEWVDWWIDHDSASNLDWTQNDWVIDTWLIDKQFSWVTNIDTSNSVIAWSNNINYWKPLFNTSINVSNFRVFPYPNLDNKYFWKDASISSNISPYLILNFEIKPSWEVRKKLKKEWKPLNFNLTVNLTDIFSK